MALTNYTELQAEVANFLNRDDLTAAIPTFIRLAEAKMNYLEVEKNEDNQESLEEDNQDETEA